MRRPRKGSLAEKMLRLLEDAYPAGVPTRELAQRLYGDEEERGKVARLARSLRRLGFAVFGFGGVYYLGTETILEMAVVRYGRVGCGFYLGGLEALKNLAEKDPERARELLRLIKDQVNDLLRRMKV
ncbi:hypothetical protein [Ammonifex thiophilus]|uniref:Uncharacterized protein n=1 Tax=Ammonifex thiophilus TaxID=444093 RepID=A0A3D8P2W4_9THEO|nr:hypothetical protein [Ammonifex thiophilus]RDV81178.1 hypothetical protein DXX99_09815 [Ammonifex thiophilus]